MNPAIAPDRATAGGPAVAQEPAITHAPGHMFITDVPDQHYAI